MNNEQRRKMQELLTSVNKVVPSCDSVTCDDTKRMMEILMDDVDGKKYGKYVFMPFITFQSTVDKIIKLEAELNDAITQAGFFADEITNRKYDNGELEPEIFHGYKDWIDGIIGILNASSDDMNITPDNGVTLDAINDLIYPFIEEIKSYQGHTRDQIIEALSTEPVTSDGNDVIKIIGEKQCAEKSSFGILQRNDSSKFIHAGECEPQGQSAHDIHVNFNKDSNTIELIDDGVTAMSIDLGKSSSNSNLEENVARSVIEAYRSAMYNE